MMAVPARTALLLAALLVLPVAVTAQDPGRSRLSGGIALLNTQPLGDLRTGPGIGLALSGAWALDRSHRLRIRGDVRLSTYGHERRRFCINETIGCWIQVDVDTDFNTIYAGVGPELALSVLGTELVLDATAGLGHFGVVSTLQGIDDSESIATTNHYQDYVFAWATGGELRIPVSRVLAISLGTHYVHNGRASYVVEGGITQSSDGTLNISPLTTDANMVAITLGITFRPTVGDAGARIR